MRNVYSIRNRARKVKKLLEAIRKIPVTSLGERESLAIALEEYPQEKRDIFAAAFGVTPPSPDTWSDLCKEVRSLPLTTPEQASDAALARRFG